MSNKIEIYHDGPKDDQLSNLISTRISGFTFNPTIFKKLQIADYLDACKKFSKLANDKPVSLEIIADNKNDAFEQAIKLSDISNNVFVKIPVMFTNKEPTYELIKDLVKKNIKLNITAILSVKQIKELIPITEDTENILSIFVGRIYDSGLDGEEYLKDVLNYKKRKFKFLWASARMAFDVIKAERSGFDIITLTTDLIQKYNKFGIDLEEVSKNTVKQFYDDAVSSGFKL